MTKEEFVIIMLAATSYKGMSLDEMPECNLKEVIKRMITERGIV